MYLSNRDGPGSVGDHSQSRANKTDSREGGRPIFASKLAKIEFPKFSGNDLTEWLTQVDQFFDYQRIDTSKKVYFASYHLQGEANQWWRWLKRTYQEEGNEISWDIFVEEL